MSVPTKGETFAKLVEYLRKAQEEAATLAHLNNADGDQMGRIIAKGWLGVSDVMNKIVHEVTQLATKGYQ